MNEKSQIKPKVVGLMESQEEDSWQHVFDQLPTVEKKLDMMIQLISELPDKIAERIRLG